MDVSDAKQLMSLDEENASPKLLVEAALLGQTPPKDLVSRNRSRLARRRRDPPRAPREERPAGACRDGRGPHINPITQQRPRQSGPATAPKGADVRAAPVRLTAAVSLAQPGGPCRESQDDPTAVLRGRAFRTQPRGV